MTVLPIISQISEKFKIRRSEFCRRSVAAFTVVVTTLWLPVVLCMSSKAARTKLRLTPSKHISTAAAAAQQISSLSYMDNYIFRRHSHERSPYSAFQKPVLNPIPELAVIITFVLWKAYLDWACCPCVDDEIHVMPQTDYERLQRVCLEETSCSWRIGRALQLVWRTHSNRECALVSNVNHALWIAAKCMLNFFKICQHCAGMRTILQYAAKFSDGCNAWLVFWKHGKMWWVI